MDIFWGLLLGAVQGLTEFLPVSSSGHLVIIQSLIPGFNSPGIVLEVILHAGTTLAVLVFFRKTIVILLKKYIKFIIIASIPAAVVGILFRGFFEEYFFNTKIVGVALLLTAGINYLTDKTVAAKSKLNNKKVFIVGIAQAFAITPGISRSGFTIFSAVRQGISPKEAAQFSFLLSIPAIIGANLLELFERPINSYPNIQMLVTGFVAAFIFGFFAIRIVLKFLEQKKFHYFSVYCLMLGLLLLIF